jgi:tetratricopeptide (TPR) repeat protein
MPTPEELRAQAKDLLLRGDTGGGITDLKEYLKAEPEDADAWLLLGTAYASIQHFIQAADALKEAVELDGDLLEARLAYARALVQLKKLDLAAFQLLQAEKLEPTNVRVLKELGLVFYDKKLYDKAALWLSKAALAEPTDARAHYALGLAHEARRDMGAAVASYREALARDPKLADAYRTLADALASMGEHEGAIAALSALLEIERSNEQAAHNREVLTRALAEMRQHRLLGKGQKELEASALISEGAFRKKGPVEGGALTVRFAAPLVELYATFDAAHSIEALLLVLTDPDRAARAEDDTFKVTVIAKDGHREPVNFATAVSLTFLREALGCPMTQASELYARVLGGEAGVEWGGAALGFDSIPRPDKPSERRHGLRVSLRSDGAAPDLAGSPTPPAQGSPG